MFKKVLKYYGDGAFDIDMSNVSNPIAQIAIFLLTFLFFCVYTPLKILLKFFYWLTYPIVICAVFMSFYITNTEIIFSQLLPITLFVLGMIIYSIIYRCLRNLKAGARETETQKAQVLKASSIICIVILLAMMGMMIYTIFANAALISTSLQPLLLLLVVITVVLDLLYLSYKKRNGSVTPSLRIAITEAHLAIKMMYLAAVIASGWLISMFICKNLGETTRFSPLAIQFIILATYIGIELLSYRKAKRLG